ncbi:glycosyltransferase [Pseudoxanthomonas taiwanensis]|uniref:Glycosyltransferase n=1 Tax=Pseudoxanthomonas taiwanensis TaxID=176598 RepID=A0A921NUL7_9GAMM|nr:glycosyltransferase [Pseudoxanthomonas taiwanensis]KAF1688288.1 hypothetical protein CR938_10825 [Pseudoxanthomonas taiwanensis]
MRINKLMVAWVGYQRRAEAMRSFWEYEIVYFPKAFRNKALLPLDYLWRLFLTATTVIRHRPSELWIQAPPSFLIYLAVIYKKANKRARVLADIHNSFLRKKWSTMPLLPWCLSQLDAIVVHNNHVKKSYEDTFGSSTNVFVLEDRAIEVGSPARRSNQDESVLFPCSFDEDEPIDIVLAAAKSLPTVRFFITGRPKSGYVRKLAASAPPNVVFTGFISIEEFDSLLERASLVLGLTTRPDVQLSAANEAVSYGKAMVLSDTPTLRELFPGARFVESTDPDSIRAGIADALQRTDHFEEASRSTLAVKAARWRAQAERLGRVLYE